jgi:hypothetical protein
MNVVNIKVLANLIILILKFQVHRPVGLGVNDVRSLLLGSAHALNRSECLVYSTCILMKSCLGYNGICVVLLLSFPKC